eukprot:gene918-1160_t
MKVPNWIYNYDPIKNFRLTSIKNSAVFTPYEGRKFAAFNRNGQFLNSTSSLNNLPPKPDSSEASSSSDSSYSTDSSASSTSSIPPDELQDSTTTTNEEKEFEFEINDLEYSQLIDVQDTSYLLVIIDSTVILNLTSSQYNPKNKNGYQLVSIDITNFADGGNHNLSFVYGTTGNLISPTSTFLIDYITMNPTPSNLIENDIYLSNLGNDYTGNGTMNNTFCSIQRAVNSIAEGYKIYILTNLSMRGTSPLQMYIVDTLGKNITLIGKNLKKPGELIHLFPNHYGYKLFIASGSFTGENLFLKGNVRSLIAAPDSSTCTLINCKMNNAQTAVVNSKLASAITGYKYSQVYLQKCYISYMTGTSFEMASSVFSIENSIFHILNGPLFYLNAWNTNLTLTKVESSGVDTSFLNTTLFDTIRIQYSTFKDSYLSRLSRINNGRNFFINNCFYSGTTLGMTIHEVENILISDNVYNLVKCVDSPTYNFVRSMKSTIILQNLLIANSTVSTVPHVSTNNVGKIGLYNITLIQNRNPFLISYNTELMSLNQINIYECLGETQIQLYQSQLWAINIVFQQNRIPLLSMIESTLYLTDADISNNFNYNTLPMPMISIQQSVNSSSISSTHFTQNFNFELIRFYNSYIDDSMSITNCTFMNNYMGSLINIQSTFHVFMSNLTVVNNFLSVYYPIYTLISDIVLINSYFDSNSNYFFFENTDFKIKNTQFQDAHCINTHSLFINNSRGSFEDVKITNGTSSSGINIVHSVVEYNHCEFSNLYSYQTPLGHYEKSNITFNLCTFVNNSAGDTMFTFEKGVTSFNGCNFNKLSGILMGLENSMIIRDSLVANTRGNNGLILTRSNVSIVNTLFTNNLSQELFTSILTNITFTNCVFFQNKATLNLQNQYIVFRGCAFQYNTVNTPLFSLSFGNLVMESTTLSNNLATRPSSIISAVSMTITLINSSFYGQAELQSNGAIINAADSIIIVRNSNFWANFGHFGGIIYMISTDLSMFGANFTGNYAYAGGVLYSINSTIYDQDSIYVSNRITTPKDVDLVTSDGNGGSIYLQGSLYTGFNIQFIGNTAQKLGGAIYQSQTSSHFFNSSFSNNTVQFGAGGVCYSPDSPCIMSSDCVFQYNQAGYGPTLATSPESLSLNFSSNSYHPYTTFFINVALLDYYNQSTVVLQNLVWFQLSIYRVNLTDGSMVEYSTNFFNKTLQGWFQVPTTLQSPVGTTFYINASTSLGFKAFYQLELTECDPGYERAYTNSSCVLCEPGTYGYNGKTCIECAATKVICPGGNQIIANVGNWILPGVEPPNIFSCDPDICLLGQCREGHQGILCSDCIPGYSKVKTYCESCSKANPIIILGFVLFFIFYVLMMTVFKVPSSTLILNILLILQIIGVFGFNIEYLMIVPLFDFSVDYWPLSCFYPLSFLWKSTISLITIAVVLLLCILFRWGKLLLFKILRPKYFEFLLENFENSTLYTIVSHLITLYTPLTFISISLVTCASIGENEYLMIDPSTQCFTKPHLALFVISCILLFFVTLGLPLFLFIQIRRKRRYFIKVFFLEKYRREYVWWDILLLFRSLTFIVVTISVTFHMDAKGLITASLSLLFTGLNWICQPYKNKHRNDLDTHLGLILCLSGLIINSRAFGSSEILPGLIISLCSLFALGSLVLSIVFIVTSKKKSHSDQLLNYPSIFDTQSDLSKPLLSKFEKG